jgi:hypothetical protein
MMIYFHATLMISCSGPCMPEGCHMTLTVCPGDHLACCRRGCRGFPFVPLACLLILAAGIPLW